MSFYQYFVVLIFTLCLMLTVFNAQVDALNITYERGAPCTTTSICVIAQPYDGIFKVKCQPEGTLPSDSKLSWVKVNAAVQTNDRVKIYESGNDLVLEFAPIVPDDMSKYDCRQVKKDVDPIDGAPDKLSTIEIQVLPYVKQAHKDFTVVEENSFNLTCTVLSKVPTTVTWTVKTDGINDNFTASADRIILDKINDTTNGMLYVKSANLSLDRGTYECKAQSIVGISTTGASYMIRLKSKYASLWPFLGIVAEVIVLVAIILIYEKKRDKTEMEESDTDQGPETKNSPDHGQDGVRYRK